MTRPKERDVPGLPRDVESSDWLKYFQARWYNKSIADQWYERQVYYHAYVELLVRSRSRRHPGWRWAQPRVTKAPGLNNLTFCSAVPDYRIVRGRAYSLFQVGGVVPSLGQGLERPSETLLLETKVYTFSFYRKQVLDADLGAAARLRAYVRAVAAWASDHPTLAACSPHPDVSLTPLWVEQDLRKLLAAVLGTATAHPRVIEGAEAIVWAVDDMVDRILEDATLTALGAFNFVRPVIAAMTETDVSKENALLLQRLLAEVADQRHVEAMPPEIRANLLALARHLPLVNWPER